MVVYNHVFGNKEVIKLCITWTIEFLNYDHQIILC